MAGRLSFETFRCGRHSSCLVHDPRCGEKIRFRIEIVTDVQESRSAE